MDIFCFLLIGDFSTKANVGSIRVFDGWAWSTHDHQYGSMGFVTLSTDETMILVEANSPLVSRIEMHENFIDAYGRRGMRRLNKVKLIPKQPFVMNQNGVHLMLVGVRSKLKRGDQLPLTLVFDIDGKIKSVHTQLQIKAP
ncbi:copper chaperone PCu(A)C [Laribacter hongkongensis]|uniref:DUF461 domain containing protein n=1 Tax=Laribacter hongkongensis TaxID=168471 RepID=A0A248LI72_9NEIS|nr:copper chaperone PCu(A)C [Laribacter hongkongensis]ASJ24342.1 DUF461 domain containing protein [Laribacter hongkongensis]MCG9042051.1 copper chaperone PCu(A)C [Laribacter hongkongensis]MCG9069231.1 copper chaperone PCu(A)C [Laribacter hongkongensis]MCG9087894.1 copper chaperone PCu(A)C [Laribacter hongkongensis]MCG9110975.1 copper chaperone PCu(A)C [Laribacter hongkongensis]